MPEFNFWTTILLIAALIAVVMGTVAYLILAERKVAAWVQDRLGPNRVGPWGLLQPIGDGGKMFLKEDIIPSHVDKVFFLLAPMVAFGVAMLAIAVIPFGETIPPPAPTATLTEYDASQNAYRSGFNYVISPGLDVAMLYTFSVGSLAVYGVIL